MVTDTVSQFHETMNIDSNIQAPFPSSFNLPDIKLIHHASVLPGCIQHSRFTLFKSLIDNVIMNLAKYFHIC